MFLIILSFILNTLIGFLEFVIGIRLALKIIGAAELAPFVAWIYRASEAFIIPFKGVFPDVRLGFITIEPAAILAFIVYGLAGFLLNQVINYSRSHSKKETAK